MAQASLLSTFSVLAAADGQEPSLLKIVVPLAIIVVLAGILMAAISIVRKRMHPTDAATEGRGFSLGDLRQLHREGKMTDEEFERAKALLVSSVQSSLKREAKPSPGVEPLNTDVKR